MIKINEDHELELLLGLDGHRFEAAAGYLVEFTASRTPPTAQRPHGISYALVFRMDGDNPLIKFDNAHGVANLSRGYKQKPTAYDHWHRGPSDPGRPYQFESAAKLLGDFWNEVKRVLDEKGIEHDL